MNAEKRKETYSLHSLLGFLAMGKTGANPPVSAVLTNTEGQILASAHTQNYGGNHAERELYSRYFRPEVNDRKENQSLDLVSDQIPNETYKNSTYDEILSVSLEPCTHFGKTPPCRDLVIENKPKEIKLGWKDPNPLIVSGEWETYKKTGISIGLDPMLAKVSFPYLQGFLTRIQTGRPWVWIKSATSKEGNFASKDKKRERVSSVEVDLSLQLLRAKVDAVAVGPGTVISDSPSLHFRISEEMIKSHKPGTRITELEPFFEAGSGLISSILQYSKDTAEIHSLEESLYQPYRVFCLDPNHLPSNEFFKKQRDLTEKYGEKKCIFFILTDEETESFDPELENHIQSVSRFEGIGLKEYDGSKFLEILGDLGINTLLCESGNFFPNFLAEELTESDRILEIRNENKSFPTGIPFVFQNELLISEYQVGSNRIFIRKPNGSV
ncbi:bifunctional diaminohydroxyphosphoribosylaminopyrimidine deaminase/5-amino-6-(5-phosphoribosylamino)uracil reductase RibD [Leptospira kanakyensis]|uniref:bifunctional diaminohydroxyphosphoribosylaminopyrimidine deaminase/5-amino-6-(5-phosphoribosylamino)uracil reductase RibD n=1 Tax=Leptospira kanakyensis TaxID=2484968 RepID=UPI00223DA915|nr:dihydrofolate reductase family protein [Leptospira kanakyensis]MCW7470413.1 deaminase [Leptospira kanakyensis]